jgi:hypothetical protein
MRRALRRRIGAGIVLAGWAGAAGCTHNHYYYGATPTACEPGVATYGSVCDVPAPGTTIISQVPPSSAVVGSGVPRTSRVLVSEPRGGLFAGRTFSPWKAADPERVTVRSEGALDDDSTVK